jgi:arginyl-tRNA synthetase
MNGWVYEGFDSTYSLLGVDFDETNYESETYQLGKEIVDEGLSKGAFYRKEDGSVWVDLTSDGLDHKLLLRGDGTSVYITQDIGTARMRFEKYRFGQLIYVVGNEQDYHFKVLKLILKKLGYDWWDKLHHLSYAMVDLPSGKMKSREGTVVDADDLMQSMIEEAERTTLELGKVNDLSAHEQKELYQTVGLGALKYFILKVDPEKRMLFNPSESIDFNGHTGPFIQYTYTRIRSLMRKAAAYHEFSGFQSFNCSTYSDLSQKEKELIKGILDFGLQCRIAGDRLSPAVLANYAYELAKLFNQFYHEHPVVDSSSENTTLFRLHICYHCAEVLRRSMTILGIGMPDRM